MLLAIDIGNTNISAGLFKGKKLEKRVVIARSPDTSGRRSNLKLKIASLISFARNDRSPVTKVIIVSVAPAKLKKVLKVLKKTAPGIPIYTVGKNIKVPLESRYNSKQIGQDRLVTAYAASIIYGKPALIIDFGTAVTFDIISRNRVYLGGLILPGIKISLESLYKKAALLPEVELKDAHDIVATNTTASIRAGIIYGYSSICEGLTQKFKKKFKNLKVVITGGNAGLIVKHSKFRCKIDKNLSLKGLLALISLN